MTEKLYPETIVSVSGTRLPGGEYIYRTTRKDGAVTGILNSRRRYKWFHQWLIEDASGANKVIHYFSTKVRAAPVPAWVPGRAEKLEAISIVYL
jgi:hypothetical protein